MLWSPLTSLDTRLRTLHSVEPVSVPPRLANFTGGLVVAAIMLVSLRFLGPQITLSVYIGLCVLGAVATVINMRGRTRRWQSGTGDVIACVAGAAAAVFLLVV
ncbi:hypothetical protein [Tomitella cavernea]|nr:hypothetical protein [Tomitella cavernea]